MGRRLRGAALRAKKRGREAQDELVKTTADKAETKEVESKSNEELFVIDTTATKVIQSEHSKKKEAKRKAQQPSTKEQRQIDNLVKKHSPEALQQLVASGKQTSKRAHNTKKKVKANFDLWGDDAAAVSTTAADGNDKPSKKMKTTALAPTGIGSTMAGIKPDIHTVHNGLVRPAGKPKHKSIAVDVAKSGQSYNPDKIAHKKIIEAAVEVEMRREEAEKEKAAPISAGMSEETKALLLGDSDSEEEESSDEEEGENGESLKAIEKRKEKLTKAERNKQKRLREEKVEILQRKKQKKEMNAVAEAKTIAKRLRKEEAAKAAEKLKLEQLKEASNRFKGKDVIQQLSRDNPIAAPTFPVALSSDIKKTKQGGGGLRTMKPKGSLITDRMVSFSDRDMSAKKATKQKKRVEGRRRKAKVKIHGKGHTTAKDGQLLG